MCAIAGPDSEQCVETHPLRDFGSRLPQSGTAQRSEGTNTVEHRTDCFSSRRLHSVESRTGERATEQRAIVIVIRIGHVPKEPSADDVVEREHARSQILVMRAEHFTGPRYPDHSHDRMMELRCRVHGAMPFDRLEMSLTIGHRTQ